MKEYFNCKDIQDNIPEIKYNFLTTDIHTVKTATIQQSEYKN